MIARLRTFIGRLCTLSLKWPVATLLAGTVAGAAIGLIVEEWPKFHMPTFLLFVSGLILYTIGATNEIHKKIDGKLEQLELTTIGIFKAEDMYQRASEDIRSARESIMIIGPWVPLEEFAAVSKEERLGYLKVIEEVIRGRLNDPSNPDFVYKRVLQTEKAAQAADGVLTRDLIMESQLEYFDHCKLLHNLVKDKETGVEVDIRLSEPIPSMFSVLIVDNKYLHIAFPTKKRRGLGRAEEIYQLRGALVIEGRTGKGIKDFITEVFEPIHTSSHPILTVKD